MKVLAGKIAVVTGADRGPHRSGPLARGCATARSRPGTGHLHLRADPADATGPGRQWREGDWPGGLGARPPRRL